MEISDANKQYIYDRINIVGECWLWTKRPDHYGYGRSDCNLAIQVGKRKAHQLSYIIFKGPIPAGLVVRHKCRNRSCVNPEHLELGTLGQNNQDKIRDGTNTGTNGSNAGSKRYGTTLNEADVLHLRLLHSQGTQQRVLAKMFNISPGAVWRIVHRTSWTHI